MASKAANIVLYTTKGSSCGKRVQLALELKGITYKKEIVVLKNLPADFVKLRPQKQVPVVCIDGHAFGQSLAIIEMLEERWPDPPLLPSDPVQRTLARELANLVVSGIQPLANGSGPLPEFLENMSGMTALQWNTFWVDRGFTAAEQTLEKTSGKFSVGDSVTVADICLLPQYIRARNLLKMDVSKYPHLKSLADRCLTMEPFKSVCT